MAAVINQSAGLKSDISKAEAAPVTQPDSGEHKL